MLKVYVYRIATMNHSENLFVIAESKKEADEFAQKEERRAEGLWAIQTGGCIGFRRIKKGLVISPFERKRIKRRSFIPKGHKM